MGRKGFAMSEFFCRECGSLNVVLAEQTFSNGTKHARAKCDDCQADLGFVRSVETEDFVMPFGKHKGRRLADCPADYVAWLAENSRSASIRRRAAEALRLVKTP